MTVRVATESIGEAWIAIATRILEEGRPSSYDGLPILELAQTTREVPQPNMRGLVAATS